MNRVTEVMNISVERSVIIIAVVEDLILSIFYPIRRPIESYISDVNRTKKMLKLRKLTKTNKEKTNEERKLV